MVLLMDMTCMLDLPSKYGHLYPQIMCYQSQLITTSEAPRSKGLLLWHGGLFLSHRWTPFQGSGITGGKGMGRV